MKSQTTVLEDSPQPARFGVDSLVAIAAAVAISFVGNAVVMGMPLMVGALADYLHFNPQQVGWMASADLGGMFLASLFTAAVVSRVNRRVLATAGILIAIGANYLSTQFHAFESLLVVRLIAGFGGGICYSTGIACLAITSKTGRNFSIMMFGLVAINAIELYTIPSLTATWGIDGIFLAFCVAFALCLGVIPFLYPHTPAKPTVAQNEDRDMPKPRLPTYLPLACLLAVSCFYITIGSFWAFIERAGVDAGLGDAFIANVLTLGNVFTLAGCVAAVWLSNRAGQSRVLMAALAGMAGVLGLLAVDIGATTFVIGTFGFCIAWLFTDIFQLGTLSHIDGSGRYAALVPAAQGLAQTAAPATAGFLLSQQLGYSAVMLLGAAGSLVALVIYAFVYSRLRRLAPALADAV
ncbi:Predicted arabinose efflux permease, MFS family [Modicisalibacter muralis]|uniref:Predicted arabinose efflux permease, MFS family n=1 Tax=Modicisalibacter muralis TaxID=119000 RepID=A0A1G9IMR9_9GAMM|nr:MFS transporter [Halomonas muralis]SDL26461.1 Predicted arabinose efflux permease, MFS family [Halomonas muralis]